MDVQLQPKLSEMALKRLGLRAVEMIRKRTAKGEGADGKFKPYSEKWFARPAGGHTQAVQKIFKTLEDDVIKWFQRKGGKNWMTFKGYKGYKKIVYKDEFDGGTPNLRATGDMMDGFTVIGTSENSVILGWIDPELSERAAFNIMRGRDILGLTQAEIDELTQIAINDVEFS